MQIDHRVAADDTVQDSLFDAFLNGRDILFRNGTTNDLVLEQPHSFATGAQVENVRGDVGHEFVAVTAGDKLDQLAEQLRRDRGLALVFVRTKHGADRLARKLVRAHDVRAAVLHGDMSQNARERSLAQFGSGRVSTLIATATTIIVATPNVQVERFPGDCLGPSYHEFSVARNPLAIAGPLTTLHDLPGLGIEVDWDRLASQRLPVTSPP